MYRLGRRKKRSRTLLILGGTFLLAGTFVGAYWILFVHAKPNSVVSNAPPVTSYVSTVSTQKSHFNEPGFSIDLPPNWKMVNHTTAPNNEYTFQGTGTTDSTRLVSIYEDDIPTNMAVNRVVAIQAQGSGVSHGTVSDNCNNFTTQAARSTPQAQTQGIAQARWDGVDFLCDIGNYIRNVTGTSAQGSINKLTLKGSSGTHSFFFVYTDNNISPDYTILYNLLDSFEVK